MTPIRTSDSIPVFLYFVDKYALSFPKSFASVGPTCLSSSSLNTPPYASGSPHFPCFPPSGSLFEYSGSAATMLFHEEEAVQFPCPVLETVLTAGEIQELLSLIQSGDGDAASPSSGSQGSNRDVYSMDERKRRRMQSNRESARRSRWRKKRHLENLTNQVNHFSIENRQLKNRLGFAMHQHRLVCLENERLRSESVALLARLSELFFILGSMHSQ